MKFLSVAFVSLLALAVSAKQCSKSQFHHQSHRTGECCLPRGGSHNSPSPPHDKSCPRKWEWNNYFNCCIPKDSDHPRNPKCDDGNWDDDDQCCKKPTKPGRPEPSHRYGHHHYRRQSDKRDSSNNVDANVATRSWRSKTLSCAAAETVCNMSDSLASRTWACVDTQKDVNFCGGCGIHGAAGQDCSGIPNAWNVACVSGVCKVLTCESGFRVSHNGKSCVALD